MKRLNDFQADSHSAGSKSSLRVHSSCRSSRRISRIVAAVPVALRSGSAGWSSGLQHNIKRGEVGQRAGPGPLRQKCQWDGSCDGRRTDRGGRGVAILNRLIIHPRAMSPASPPVAAEASSCFPLSSRDEHATIARAAWKLLARENHSCSFGSNHSIPR